MNASARSLKISGWVRPVFVVIGMAGIAALAVEGYRAYQAHVSSDLRKTLTAALDPTTRVGDIRTYQRKARLDVHTKKDRDLDAKFERLVALTEENCDADEASMKSERKAAVESLAAADVDRDAPPVSGNQVGEMHVTVGAAHRAFDRYMDCENRINKDRRALPDMMDDLREDLRGRPARATRSK